MQKEPKNPPCLHFIFLISRQNAHFIMRLGNVLGLMGKPCSVLKVYFFRRTLSFFSTKQLFAASVTVNRLPICVSLAACFVLCLMTDCLQKNTVQNVARLRVFLAKKQRACPSAPNILHDFVNSYFGFFGFLITFCRLGFSSLIQKRLYLLNRK